MTSLQEEILAASSEATGQNLETFEKLKRGLNSGAIRAAEPSDGSRSGWRVNGWVKQGILLGFRLGAMVDQSIDRHKQPWFDKATYPVKQLSIGDGVRIVPGGSSIRDRPYIGRARPRQPPIYLDLGS